MFSRKLNLKYFHYVIHLSLISAAKKDTCIIDCSTIDVSTSKEMAKLAQSKQLRFVDAPVSGG